MSPRLSFKAAARVRLPPSDVAAAFFDKDRRREAKLDLIIRTAARLIYDRGVNQTSLEDVAARLGLSKPSLYYYVKSKADLLYLCNVRLARLERSLIETIEATGGTGAEKLEGFVRGMIAIVLDPESGLPRIYEGREGMLTPERHAHLMSENRALAKVVRGFIREGTMDGSLQVDVPELAETAITGAILWIPFWETLERQWTPEQVTDAYLKIFLNGVTAKQGRVRPRARKNGAKSRR